MEIINFQEILKTVREIKKGNTKNFKEIKIAFLRNYTTEKIIPYLEFFLLKDGFKPTFYFSAFDNIFQDTLDEKSDYYKFSPDITIIAMTTLLISEKLVYRFAETPQDNSFNEIERITSDIESLIVNLTKNKVGTILVNNFETPDFASMGILDYQNSNYQINSFRKINLKLAKICEKYSEVNVVDVDFLQRLLGTKITKDYRLWHIEKNPYSQKFLHYLAFDYIKFIRAIKGKVKKCLVLDLDDTLWGGTIGEDGIKGIKLGNTFPGSSFMNFQKSILNLYNRGVILAICSKNNIEDVIEVLKKHPDMILKKDNFAIIKANWTDKASNIKEISDELNINLDSLVFIDNNPFEINLVKKELPQVQCIQLSNDPTSYSHMIDSLGIFDNLNFSTEDLNRTKMYKVEAKRKISRKNYTNLDSYLSSLEMKVEIFKNDSFCTPRIAQLSQRTNQFNLTTKRYSEAEISSYTKDSNTDVLAIRLEDKFGDMGIIGSSIIKYTANEANIDSFLLSCRSLGRGVEDIFLNLCLEIIKKRGYNDIKSEYYKTEKNKQVENFFDTRGFKLIENNNNIEKKYISDKSDKSLKKLSKNFNIIG